MVNSPQTFGARLRDLRKSRNLTQRDLAAQIRLSLNYLDKLERDYNGPPSAAVLLDLARALRADADELFALSGKIPPQIENGLIASPLLVQLVHLGMKWGPDELRAFLAAQGVPEARLNFVAAREARMKAVERRPQRDAITAEMRRHVFSLDNHECVYCSSVSILEIDHIFPFSNGGTNQIENLVTCCARCNAKKKERICSFPMVFGRFRVEIEGEK